MEKRNLLTTIAIGSGDWSDETIWSNGVPNDEQRAIIGHGTSVQLDQKDHFAKELVVHGDLVVQEGDSDPTEVNKSLQTRWVHINSGGQFIVGSQDDRYDEGSFTLTLTGTDVSADHVIETNMMGMNPGTRDIMNNDGFLMTAMGGRVQFYGEEKLSFTKLAATAEANATTITVENTIERNYDKGELNGGDFVTSADDDGAVDWEIGDQIVIASSSYNYKEEDVRTITEITVNDDDTSELTLDSPLNYRHYGEIEVYGENAAPGTNAASQFYEIDLRAEVALLSRNVKIQGLASQDTDNDFGDRWNIVSQKHVSGEEPHISGQTFTDDDMNVVDRVRAAGLSDAEFEAAPDKQVSIGVGGHIMFMPTSGQITVDGVQLDGMGQTSQKGRYPIHWHLGNDRSGDVLRNSSITNSNNRGVTIHGTSNLQIEGVVLHDVHGHGFFFEDAVETGNELIGNIAFGIHTVGGNDKNFANPGGTDPFVVDTHDSVTETDSRFKSSAAFWITNPTNTFVGNISAGASGTGFWYAIPRAAIGPAASLKDSSGVLLYEGYEPIYAEFGQFDNNTSHSTPVGLNFDRGEDIEDASPNGTTISGGNANNYSPRTGSEENGTPTTNYVNGFTNYKAIDAGVYHRGQSNSILFNDLRIADSYNAVWSVFETEYNNSLFVGHSRGELGNDVLGVNDPEESVGGPRLYDGAGLYTNSHFAGFADDDAYAFQVEGSSFGPTMYHGFLNTSFEDDGTFASLAHAISDFPDRRVIKEDHATGLPQQWIKAVIDLDGSLTGAASTLTDVDGNLPSQVGKAIGGIGHSVVPNVAFLVDDGDFQPTGWDAWLTDDLYARVKLENMSDGERLFPGDVTGEPLVRFTARDGDSIDVLAGQNQGDASWTQTAAKTDGDGFVEGTFTIDFLRNGVPANGFNLDMKNQDGGLPSITPSIETRVNEARIVVKITAAGNYTPSWLNWNQTTDVIAEVGSEAELRSETSEVVYWRDGLGNLYLNTGITDSQRDIRLEPGEPLQTPYASRTIAYGTTIQAEHFDVGRDGFAYHDSDATNSLSTFRDSTGVDTTETMVGGIETGEWLEYTATIESAAYKIGVNVSSFSEEGHIRVLAANSNSAGFLRELGVIDVIDTGGDIETLWLDGVNLAFAAGTDSVIRLEFVGGGFDVDSMEFESATQTPYLQRAITADLTTSIIELEEFDFGGQGASYYDDSPGNSSSDEFRTDEDVDASDDQVGGDVFEGEWLEYTTDIEAGTYDIHLVKKWSAGLAGVKLFIGDSNSATNLRELDQFVLGGGVEKLTLENVDLSDWAGQDRVIRIEIIGRYMGLDKLEFVSNSQTPPTADIVDITPDPRNTSVGDVVINFHEDVTGVDLGDLTLTRDGDSIDLNGLILATLSPSQYSIDLSTVTIAQGTYELELNGVGSGIADLAGNAMTSQAVDQFIINQLDSVPPQLESVVINDGSDSRSMVSAISVTFSEQIAGVDAGSFVLINTAWNSQIIPTVTTERVNEKTVATLTFNGDNIAGGSLADGTYRLTTLANSISDAAGNLLDGNRDGTGGDDATDEFFRLFGDTDGDRDVDGQDYGRFGLTFLKDSSDPGFNAQLDIDRDGDVDGQDYGRFGLRFLTRL